MSGKLAGVQTSAVTSRGSTSAASAPNAAQRPIEEKQSQAGRAELENRENLPAGAMAAQQPSRLAARAPAPSPLHRCFSGVFVAKVIQHSTT